MVLKAKNSILLLSQTLNDLKLNFKYLVEESFKHTNNNLYIYINPFLNKILLSSNHASNANDNLLFNERYQLKTLINNFYQYSFKLNPNINVTCLLHNIHQQTKAFHQNSTKPKFLLNYDLILTDFMCDSTKNLVNFMKLNLPNSFDSDELKFLTIDCSLNKQSAGQQDNTLTKVSTDSTNDKDQLLKNNVYNNSIIGGTFDRLHIGHKILLSESALLTKNRFLIGISDGALLVKKKLADLIEDFDVRSENVKNFLNVISPDLEVIPVPITDPFGPSITEPDYQCLIVSQETRTGGELVNQKRKENNLSILDIHIVGLIKDDQSVLSDNNGDEEKVSSSNQRRRLLGTLLKDPYIPYDETKPYVIGLTGGLASGKSNIVKDLANLGAATIDSDKLGHKTYEKGTDAYKKIIEIFGRDILDDNENINRKELGKKVFGSAEELKKLTDIVWPEIRKLRDIEIKNLFEQGHKIIVVEAAVMIEAKWNQNVNEIWVCFIPDDEAIKRATERDKSTLEKAKQTVASQLPNKAKLKYANVAFCSLWEREYTQKQVKKAWDLLLKRTIQKS